MTRLTTLIERLRSPVVIDLDDCIIIDPGALGRLATAGRRQQGTTAISSRRLSGRRLMARFGVTERIPVFACVEDAVQAWVLGEAGYGRGWRPE